MKNEKVVKKGMNLLSKDNKLNLVKVFRTIKFTYGNIYFLFSFFFYYKVTILLILLYYYKIII
jgi:hypothetical protein